ncbi:MAG: alginate export family protein [Candidatus Hydrogenedentes bacterium]|nr:alginate export family protein [Candidatus Hydrogenedentota bacterium]
MKKLLVTVVLLGLAGGAVAELQNVELGGEVRVRGRYWGNNYSNAVNGPATPRYVGFNFASRPLGPFGLLSRFDFDNRGSDLSIVEQRTRLNVKADFTDDVTAFVEFESYDFWGTDFRSNYITGADGAGAADIKLYQAYIETRNTFGLPLRARIGRQEMKLGKGWLLDDITTAIIGRNYDGIRLTYQNDDLVVDGWWYKLGESFAGDNDVDFYGIYGTYSGLENVNLSAYWMMIRDGATATDTTLGLGGEWFEDLVGVDDYNSTNLHTIGTRIWGGFGAFDFDWELAYQFGEADSVGALFAPLVYGDDDANFGNFATDLVLGYTLDMAWQPRIYIGGALFEGEDNRDYRFGDRIFSGFRSTESSISFNRLFPGKNYSPLLGIGQELSNFWTLKAGVNVKPTEKISGGFRVAYFEIDEAFETPVIPFIAFWTRENDSELGWTTFLWTKYQYSEDLSIKLVWEHLFHGDGLERGQFFARNGLEFVGGTDDDDGDYVHFDVQIKF